MGLAARIETLKLKYPRSENYIESAYQRFMADDTQKDAVDFFDLLKRDVESRNLPEFTGKGLPKRRLTQRRTRARG